MEEKDLMFEKSNGERVPFNRTKIKKAIVLAMKNGGVYLPDIARIIANDAESYFLKQEGVVTRRQVDSYIVNRLTHYGQAKTAESYTAYRAVQAFKKNTNTTDIDILSLIRGSNKDVQEENSNKNATIAPTQRDLMAGEVSKDIVRRLLLPTDIVQAHDNGILHFHDSDYAIQTIFNCCLVNIKEMLENGTVMNGKMVESPKSFQVACTVMTQIIAAIASAQYGGQSIAIKHLGKYLKASETKYYNKIKKNHPSYGEEEIRSLVEERLQDELESGVQTIQYQINTISCSNGQSPFVTLFLELDDNDPYLEYTSRIIFEILKQRYAGIKNEHGIIVTPSFPKLIYVLDENNIHKDSKYKYVTNMAIKCSSKRMYPDYISAKVMRELHKGEVYSCMGL